MASDSSFVKRRAPALYAIITFKLVKWLLFVALAITAYFLSNNDLPAEFEKLLTTLGFNPERKLWSGLEERVATITETGMLKVALGTFIYSLFSLVQGVGLMNRIRWAGWLAIAESVFFIPIEIYSLVRKFHWPVLAILVVNIGIAWYLFQNRKRLFRYRR